MLAFLLAAHCGSQPESSFGEAGATTLPKKFSSLSKLHSFIDCVISYCLCIFGSQVASGFSETCCTNASSCTVSERICRDSQLCTQLPRRHDPRLGPSPGSLVDQAKAKNLATAQRRCCLTHIESMIYRYL